VHFHNYLFVVSVYIYTPFACCHSNRFLVVVTVYNPPICRCCVFVPFKQQLLLLLLTMASADKKSNKRGAKAQGADYGAILLMNQLRELKKNPIDGFSVGLADDSNMFEWRVMVEGTKGTPYEGGYFPATLSFPKEYPNKPPVMKFTTPGFWHPNGMCISILPSFLCLLSYLLACSFSSPFSPNYIVSCLSISSQYMKMVKCVSLFYTKQKKMPLMNLSKCLKSGVQFLGLKLSSYLLYRFCRILIFSRLLMLQHRWNGRMNQTSISVAFVVWYAIRWSPCNTVLHCMFFCFLCTTCFNKSATFFLAPAFLVLSLYTSLLLKELQKKTCDEQIERQNIATNKNSGQLTFCLTATNCNTTV
jgi:ubiquitin-protein ligase